MRKISILIFHTLDGIMQAPSQPEEDYSGGFTKGGWANNCWDEVMEQVWLETMIEPYDLLLGRTTYEIFASSFVNAASDNAIAEKLNNAKKYVVTSSIEDLQWQNSLKIKGISLQKYLSSKTDKAR